MSQKKLLHQFNCEIRVCEAQYLQCNCVCSSHELL